MAVSSEHSGSASTGHTITLTAGSCKHCVFFLAQHQLKIRLQSFLDVFTQLFLISEKANMIEVKKGFLTVSKGHYCFGSEFVLTSGVT